MNMMGHVELDMTWRLNTYMYVMYLCYGKEIDEKTSLSLDLGNWSYGSGNKNCL